MRAGSGAGRRVGLGLVTVLTAEGPIDVQQHRALTLGEARVGDDGELDRTRALLVGIEMPART
jgi:hypothetical protein